MSRPDLYEGDATTRSQPGMDVCDGQGDFITKYGVTPGMVVDSVVAAITQLNGPCSLSEED